MKKIIINILVLVGILSQVTADESKGMPVYVKKMTNQTLRELLPVFSVIKTSKDTKVSSQYGGRLTSLHVTKGMFVKKGKLLATLQTQKAEALKNSSKYGLKDIKIYAPINGYVTNLYTHVGEVISSAQPIATIVSTNHKYMSIDVPSHFLHKLKNGMMVRVDKQNLKIDRIIPIINPITHTFEVISYIKNSSLYAGEVYKGILVLNEKRVEAINRSAVLSEDGKKYVFIVSNGIAKKSFVTIGLSNDKFIEIKKGIKPNEDVVVLGNYELYDGIQVEVK